MPQLQQENQLHAGKRLAGLDHLRALAILLVFFFHYGILSHGKPNWLPDVAGFGWTGVDLFFVLSGFLISSQLFAEINAGKQISFPSFFLKRFFRIVPAYLVTLILYFGFTAFHERESLPALWKFLTFTQNFGMDIKDHGTFSHAWSLCVEEHFYLVLPLLLIFLLRTGFLRWSGWLLLLIFVSGFFIRHSCFTQAYLPHIDEDDSWLYWYRYIYYPTYSRLDGLLAGVALAAFVHFRPLAWAKISKYGNLLLISGLLILTGAYFLCEDQSSYPASVFGFPLVALGYLFLVAGAVSPQTFLFRYGSRITAFLAAVSYALYLTHKGVIHLVHTWLSSRVTNDNVLLLISFVACVLAAYLMHILIEKPFMRLRRKFVAV